MDEIENYVYLEGDDIVHLDNVTASDCGLYGITFNQCVGIRMESCLLNSNNYLVYRAGTMRWASGALKAFQIHKAYILNVDSNDKVLRCLVWVT